MDRPVDSLAWVLGRFWPPTPRESLSWKEEGKDWDRVIFLVSLINMLWWEFMFLLGLWMMRVLNKGGSRLENADNRLDCLSLLYYSGWSSHNSTSVWKGKSRGMKEVKYGQKERDGGWGKYTEEMVKGRFTVILKRYGNKNRGAGDFSSAFWKLSVSQNKSCAFQNELRYDSWHLHCPMEERGSCKDVARKREKVK